MTPEIVVALILSVIGALGHFVKDTHIKKCDCLGIKSDCMEGNIDKELAKLNKTIDKNKSKIDSLQKKRNSFIAPSTPSSISSTSQDLDPITERETMI